MSIAFQHKEYKENKETWKMIDSICEGDDVTDYLRTLNPLDTSPENKARNEAYKEHAVFYPIAGRTAEGLVSLMFSKKPDIEVPKALDYMKSNADGAGVSIFQQSQDVAGDVIKVARGGLFTTYPKVDKELSVADMATGKYFSTIHEYEADQIINWQYTKVGAQVLLSLIVMMESVDVKCGDYEVEEVEQIRELSLVDGVFYQTLWRKNEKDEWIVFEAAYAPKDGYGKTWYVIPFTFIGSKSNSSGVDYSIMKGLAEMNKGHYRNSADYEDNVWFIGQSQPWMSGVNQGHVDLMKKNNMRIGSRELLAVPSGETFGFASADSNPLVRQAMLDKVDAMIGMGARYIQPTGVAKTATEASGDQAVTHAPLAMISHNVSEAYTQSLKWAARFMKLPEDGISYETNKEFIEPNATAQDIQAMVAGFLQGAIPTVSYFRWLKKVDIEAKERTLDEFTADLGSVNMPNLADGTKNGM